MDEVQKAMQIVGSAMNNILNIPQNKKIFKRKLEELESIETDINIQLEHAESSSSKKRKNEVENWLINVERIKNEALKIDSEVGLSTWSTLLGNSIEKMTLEVEELIGKGRFEGGLLRDADYVGEDALVTTKMVGQAFRTNMEKIWACLVNNEILRIGIYGMGGVGKTTLVTHIHNRLLESKKKFAHVYWVTVSQDFSIYRLQSLIAKTIGLYHFDEDDERKRAAKLSKALNARGKCVLILDDLWNHFSEEVVGVPTRLNGCKLIITSRSLEVCRWMDCKVKIKVQSLSQEEACNLFMEKLGCELPLEINEIAKSVVRECAGLPLGIVTMAGSMRGVEDVCEWRDVLKGLKESKLKLDHMEDEVFKVLRFSYNRLNDWALEQCFLYCALFPEYFEIKREDLIEYLIVEGIIEEMSSRQEQFDRGHAMVNKLENVCLLEGSNEVYRVRYVKMHDLIRDLTIQIMKSSTLAAMVESGKQLKAIHEEKYWREDLLRVILVNNCIMEIPVSHFPKCRSLISLLLFGNGYLVKIADSFFKYLHALKVLDLSYTDIQKLPNSVASLRNLTALLLRSCSKLTELPSLAKLRALKKLDLCYTGLEAVPEGMELLSNLTYLDLFGTQIKYFPCQILPKLSHLRCLGFPYVSLTSKEIIEELAGLQKLETLICWFQDFGVYNSYLERQKLIKHQLFVSPNQDKFDSVFLVTVISQVKFEGNMISKEIHLPSNTQNLEICNDYVESGRGLCFRNAIELKSLTIQCSSIESLFDLSSSPCIFQSLETLTLRGLEKLYVLFNGEGDSAPSPTTLPLPPNGTFSNLTLFQLHYCRSMKKLFHPTLIRNLQNLEVLAVFCCHEMEEIIAVEEQGEKGSTSSSTSDSYFNPTDVFVLPKLRALRLQSLPKLKTICSGKLICNSLQEIEIECCEKLVTYHFLFPCYLF